MCAQGFLEVRQHGPALQTQRLHHGQDALHETAAALTATPETTLPPQHLATQHTLRMIVGRFYALDKRKRPQRLLPCQQLAARPPRRRAAAAQTTTQQRLHIGPNGTQYLVNEPGRLCVPSRTFGQYSNNTADNANKSSPIRRLVPRRSDKARKSRIRCAQHNWRRPSGNTS